MMTEQTFEVAVGRTSLCEQSWNAVLSAQDGRMEPLILSRALPLPKSLGTIDLIEQCLQRAPPACRVNIAIPDLNIVHFLSGSSIDAEVDDEHLIRLSNVVRPARARLQVSKAADYGRLRLRSGEAAARARVAAVESCALYFYPSPHPQSQDSWEVRFLDKESPQAVCTYERFLDWGEKELLRYIDVAVKLGNAERLQPHRLALEDPGVFWQICFRYSECFPMLRATARQKEWSDKLEEGLLTASKCGKAAFSMPSFGRKFEKELLSEGEAARARMATEGAAYGLQRVLEHTDPNVELQIEMDEDLHDEPVGKLLREVEGRLSHPEEKFREDLAALSLQVGVRVEIEGLKNAPQHNGKKGMVKGLDDAAQRLEVELEGGRMLRVRPQNARPEGVQGRGGMTANLHGACRVCAGCKKTESAPGIYKACSGCHAVHYCGRDCQTRDWKRGGHKLVCGKEAEALIRAGVRRFVVLPVERDAYPYVQTAQGASFAEQMQHIGASVLGCRDPREMRSCKIERGEPGDLVGVLLMFNQASTARGNARASGLTVPPGQMLQLDSRGDLSAVCGNAVLLRMAVEAKGGGSYAEVNPPALADLDLEECVRALAVTKTGAEQETYQRSLGIFSMFQIPSAGVLTSFFGKTPEGEAAAEEMAKMIVGRAGGLPSDDEIESKIEQATALKVAAANRKKGKKKR